MPCAEGFITNTQIICIWKILIQTYLFHSSCYFWNFQVKYSLHGSPHVKHRVSWSVSKYKQWARPENVDDQNHLELATAQFWYGLSSKPMWLVFRACLHKTSASILWQLCDDPSNSVLIENDRIAPEWGCNPFSSDSIVFNENRITSAIAELSQCWCWYLV